jgi:hypothetical protein
MRTALQPNNPHYGLAILPLADRTPEFTESFTLLSTSALARAILATLHLHLPPTALFRASKRRRRYPVRQPTPPQILSEARSSPHKPQTKHQKKKKKQSRFEKKKRSKRNERKDISCEDRTEKEERKQKQKQTRELELSLKQLPMQTEQPPAGDGPAAAAATRPYKRPACNSCRVAHVACEKYSPKVFFYKYIFIDFGFGACPFRRFSNMWFGALVRQCSTMPQVQFAG